ncbi:hypothetical protein [Cryptosporangium sp. NPDC048952]
MKGFDFEDQPVEEGQAAVEFGGRGADGRVALVVGGEPAGAGGLF